jgi:hypothetical protein
MCMGCAAAYAAIAASTATFSLSDFNEKQPGLQFAISFDDLSKTITTTPTGSSAITIKSTAPVINSAAVNRGIDPGSHQAV